MRGIQPLHPTQPTGLLNLPVEIRLEIYRYSLIRQEPIQLHIVRFYPDQRDPKRHAVVLISRQLSEEALDVLYGENVFKASIYWDDQNALNKFALANRQRIRRLHLFAHTYVAWSLPFNVNLHTLRPTLANLTWLYIVVLLPVGVMNWGNALTLEQDMHEWLTQLKDVLEYVNQHVSSRATIIVHDSNREETRELVKKCLSNGYRKAHSWTGGIWFRSGEFSLDDGYNPTRASP